MKPKREKPELTPRQRRFVEAYLTTLNAASAARLAGYSAKTARSLGSRLLTNVNVREAIEAAKKERAKESELTSELVLRELYLIVSSSVEHFEVRGGKLGVKKGERPERMRAVASVRRFRDGSFDFKLWDKPKALLLSCRHLGLFSAEKYDVRVEPRIPATDWLRYFEAEPEPAELPTGLNGESR